jgi:hypothetical protein
LNSWGNRGDGAARYKARDLDLGATSVGHGERVIFAHECVLYAFHNLVVVLDDEGRLGRVCVVIHGESIVDASKHSASDQALIGKNKIHCGRCGEPGHRRSACSKPAGSGLR